MKNIENLILLNFQPIIIRSFAQNVLLYYFDIAIKVNWIGAIANVLQQQTG